MSTLHRRLLIPIATAGVIGMALTGCVGDAPADTGDIDCSQYTDYGTFEGSPEVSIYGTIVEVEADLSNQTPAFVIIGLVILLAMVFGGFAITGGALEPVLHALPHEMLIIGGAALGALIIGNSGRELKALGGGFMKVLKGPKYKKQDYLDVIFLVSKLMKMLRVDGPIALEPHVEDPKSSAIFAEYPRLLADHTLVDLISDTLRLVVVSSGTLDVHAVEDVMDNAIKTHHHHVEFGQIDRLPRRQRRHRLASSVKLFRLSVFEIVTHHLPFVLIDATEE